jgi:hypothetical protein
MCILASFEHKGEPIEQLSNFVYMDATTSGDGTMDRDFDVRIRKANGAFNSFGRSRTAEPLKLPLISGPTRLLSPLRSYCMVQRSKKQLKRFEGFHQASLRRIFKIK